MENIEEVTARAPSTNFSTHKDHSKWVLAARAEKPYVCIGDINRMVRVSESIGIASTTTFILPLYIIIIIISFHPCSHSHKGRNRAVNYKLSEGSFNTF